MDLSWASLPPASDPALADWLEGASCGPMRGEAAGSPCRSSPEAVRAARAPARLPERKLPVRRLTMNPERGAQTSQGRRHGEHRDQRPGPGNVLTIEIVETSRFVRKRRS